MRPFDLEKAKAGARLCTRDGRPARIICWDAGGGRPIIALIKYTDGEEVPYSYLLNGKLALGWNNDCDLMLTDDDDCDLMLADDND